MALKPDTVLLTQTNAQQNKVLNTSYIVEAPMNERLARQMSAEGLDKLVKESLVIALDNANIFAKTNSQNYRIIANIDAASQAAWGFGRFSGMLTITYQVYDENGSQIYTEKITTEAESDKYYFAGQKRHTRSRIINVSKNVSQFVNNFNRFIREH